MTPVQKESRIGHCCVVYYLDSVRKEEEVRVLPHGNTLKRTRPYIRTSGETMDKLRDDLSSRKSRSQSQQLRDKKQVKNFKGLLNSKKKQNKRDAEKKKTDENDEIYEILH